MTRNKSKFELFCHVPLYVPQWRVLRGPLGSTRTSVLPVSKVVRRGSPPPARGPPPKPRRWPGDGRAGVAGGAAAADAAAVALDAAPAVPGHGHRRESA